MFVFFSTLMVLFNLLGRYFYASSLFVLPIKLLALMIRSLNYAAYHPLAVIHSSLVIHPPALKNFISNLSQLSTSKARPCHSQSLQFPHNFNSRVSFSHHLLTFCIFFISYPNISLTSNRIKIYNPCH